MTDLERILSDFINKEDLKTHLSRAMRKVIRRKLGASFDPVSEFVFDVEDANTVEDICKAYKETITEATRLGVYYTESELLDHANLRLRTLGLFSDEIDQIIENMRVAGELL